MVDIQILYQEIDITADVHIESARFVSQAGGQPGQCSIRVRDKGHAYLPGYFHVGGTLQLIVNGMCEWDGWVMGIGRDYAFAVDNTERPQLTPRWWALEGYDRNLLLSKRVHFDKAQPENADFGLYPAGAVDQDVIYELLNKYTTLEDDGLDLVSGITKVGEIDPYEAIKVASLGMVWTESMRKIATLNGAIYYIDPDRVVRYVDDSTMTAPFALSDEPASGEVGYRELVINDNADEMVNDALIWGVGVGSNDPAFAREIAEDAALEHGLFQYGELVQGMYATKSVARRADSLVNGSPDHQRGHKNAAVRIQCTIFEHGLRVGMGVSFHSGAWDMGGGLAVPPDDYTPAITDGSLFDRFMAQIRKIESGNNYDPHHQNRRSAAMGAYQIMPGSWKAWAPLALGLPRSVGVAAKSLSVDDWYPPPTAENQEKVARWRMTLLYQHKGDLRRVAASWRSGPGVGNREPSEWSRGTLFYVNHACKPLGFPETTNATVLDPLAEPDLSRDDYGSPVDSDDVYPVRKIEMTFPTPTSVKYALLLSHELDAPWAWEDPIHHDNSGPQTEVIYLNGTPDDWAASQPPDIDWDADVPLGGGGFSVRVNRLGGEVGDLGHGIYSSVGRKGGIDHINWPDTNCGLGSGAWTGWESIENWHGVGPGAIELNKWVALELTLGKRLVTGLVPSIQLRIADSAPSATSYGTGSEIGIFANSAPGVAVDPNWEDTLGQPGHIGDFGSVVIPRGTLKDGCFLILSPNWQCHQGLAPPSGYWCDSSYFAIWGYDEIGAECANRNPGGGTGMGNSGEMSGSMGSLRPIAAQTMPGSWPTNPIGGTQNGPSTYWTGGQYRTLYPYVPGSLEITWQGTQLTRGVDYFEIDPARGIFSITARGSGEGSITVHYWRPNNALPTEPLPGEPSDPSNPPPGSSGSDAIEAVIKQAYSMLHVPYQVGSESRSRTDCSGLVFRCFTDAGVGGLIGNKRLRAAGYANYFAKQHNFSRSFSSAQRGDLIVYSHNGVHVSHIGIYLGNGMIVSALTTTGVTVTHYNRISVPFYGVCMVPYDRARTSTDTTGGADDDPEEEVDPTEDLPPQTEPPETGRVYRPRGQAQHGWGTQWDGQNCNMACSAMCLDRHTLGAHNDITGTPLSTPAAHRLYSGVTALSRAGTTIEDAVTAWAEGWGETLVNPGLTTWDNFKILVNEGRGAIVQGVQMDLPTELRKTDWPDAHALYINEQLPDGTFWGIDPLYREPLLYPEAALRAYALSIHGDMVICGFSRKTPRF